MDREIEGDVGEPCEHTIARDVEIAHKLDQTGAEGELVIEVWCRKCDRRGLVTIRDVDVKWDNEDDNV